MNSEQEDSNSAQTRKRQHRCSVYIPVDFYEEYMLPLEGKANWSQIARDSFKAEALRLREPDNCSQPTQPDTLEVSLVEWTRLREDVNKILRILESTNIPATPAPVLQESVEIIGTLVAGTVHTDAVVFTLKNTKGDKFPTTGFSSFEGRLVKVTGSLTSDNCIHVSHMQLHLKSDIDLSSIPPPPPF